MERVPGPARYALVALVPRQFGGAPPPGPPLRALRHDGRRGVARKLKGRGQARGASLGLAVRLAAVLGVGGGGIGGVPGRGGAVLGGRVRGRLPLLALTPAGQPVGEETPQGVLAQVELQCGTGARQEMRNHMGGSRVPPSTDSR